MIAAASSAVIRAIRGWIVCTCPFENDDIMGGGTDSDSEPVEFPLVGEERRPGVTTGSPLPRLRSVVQPNAAMEAQRETARNARNDKRPVKFCFVSSLLI
jgi:hypothetical protein